MDRLVLRLPLMGGMVRKSLVARFTLSFATLLRSGIPALEALEVMAGMTPNALLADEIARMRQDVIDGRDLSARMHTSRVFPPMVGYMVAVGERSGTLPGVLEHVAEAFDEEVEIESQRALAVLEPALVLTMAAVVGFVASSLMRAILELSSF